MLPEQIPDDAKAGEDQTAPEKQGGKEKSRETRGPWTPAAQEPEGKAGPAARKRHENGVEEWTEPERLGLASLAHPKEDKRRLPKPQD